MTALTQPRATAAAGLFLALCCLFCLYRWHFQAQDQAAAALDRLTAVLRAEAAAIPNAAEIAAPANSAPLPMPELLAKVQEAATTSGVAVRAIIPVTANSEELRITVGGNFRNAMRFLGRLETLPVAITAFTLSQDEKGDAVLEASWTKTAKPAAPASLADYVDAVALYSAVRDPFVPGDPIPLPNNGDTLGDLSWTHHLSSISLLGAARVATIDGKDYEVGDRLDGMTVTAIGPSSVTLQAPGKVLPQKLHFRRNPDAGARP